MPNRAITFLPIADRELRVATRRSMTWWSRVIAASIAIALTVWMLGTLGSMVAPNLLGARLFATLSRVAFFCCLLPGAILTADCISEEKRAGTLGLLFLTDLKGFDVVLGKLVVTSLRAFYALFAILPFLALPFFMGGVTPGEFWRMVAVLANTLFLSLSVGMLFSVLCWHEQRAMLGTAATILALTFVLPAFGLLSPDSAYRMAFDAAFTLSWFVISCTFIHAVAWICLYIASLRVMGSWQKRDRHAVESQPVKASRQRHLLERRPLEWLALAGKKSGWIWASLAIPPLLWLAAYLRNPTAFRPEALMLVVGGWHAILQFWITWEATRSLNETRRLGELEQVLVTPVTVDEILDGQVRALMHQFLPMLGLVLAFDTLIAIGVGAHFRNLQHHQSIGVMSVLIGFVATATLQCYTLGWAGLWLGLKCPKAVPASLRTMVRGVVLPTGLFLLALYLLVRNGGFLDPEFLVGCSTAWVTIGGFTGYWVYVNAQKKLLTQFRHTAALFLDKPPKPPAPPRDANEDFGLLR